MPTICQVCSHPSRDELERRAQEGAGPRVLAGLTETEFPPEVDKDAFTRHDKNAKERGGCPTDPRRESEKPTRMSIVEGWRLADDGVSIVEAADPRSVLESGDSRYSRIAAALGLGEVVEDERPAADVPTLGPDAEIATLLANDEDRLTREAAPHETSPGLFRSPGGAITDWRGELRSWRSSLGSPEQELLFLRDLDRMNRIPTADWSNWPVWRPRIRERIAALEAHIRKAQEERRERERDPLDVEAEELQRQIGPLCLDVEAGDAGAGFKLDEIEARLAAIEAQRRRKDEAQREREKRSRLRQEEERHAAAVAAKARKLEKQREEDETSRLLMASLVTTLDAAATLLHIYGEQHDLGFEVARLNGGGGASVSYFVERKAALADLISHSFATRGQLSPYFELSRVQRGPLFTLLADACNEADHRRDEEHGEKQRRIEALLAAQTTAEESESESEKQDEVTQEGATP